MHRIKRLGESGFSFLTSLFDLLVLLTMLPLIVLFYGFAMGFTEDLDPHQSECRLFAVDLQNYLNNGDSLEIINGGSGIRVIKMGEEYDIELYTDMIRKQKARKGHEVMLTRVRKCNFSLAGNTVKVRIEFTTGTVEEAEYVFTQL